MTAVEDRQSEFLCCTTARSRALCGFLLAWFRDFHDAEKVRQQTSLELWQNFATYRPEQSFNAWALARRNQALKELRRQKTRPAFASPEVMQAVAATAAAMRWTIAAAMRGEMPGETVSFLSPTR